MRSSLFALATCLFSLPAFSAALDFATYTSTIGTSRSVTVTGYPFTVCPVGAPGCGGSFRATVYTGPVETGTATSDVDIWCVDSQFNSINSNYNASIVALSAIPSNSNVVRYGSIGTTGWGYDNPGGVTNDTAQMRYIMAAALIQQYDPSQNMPDNDLRDKAIQRAIWQLTANPNTSSFTIGDISSGVIGGSGTWLDYAASQINNVNLNGWAVISGGLNGAATGFSGSPNVQTFIVRLTGGNNLNLPEPGFYGVLAIGLTGLFTVVSRRRNAMKA